MLLIIQPNDIHNKHSATDNTVAYFFDKKSLTTRFGICHLRVIYLIHSDWFESPIKHEAYLKKRTVGDSIYYTYPNSGPSTPTVQVKATLTFNKGTYSIPAHTLSNPK